MVNTEENTNAEPTGEMPVQVGESITPSLKTSMQRRGVALIGTLSPTTTARKVRSEGGFKASDEATATVVTSTLREAQASPVIFDFNEDPKARVRMADKVAHALGIPEHKGHVIHALRACEQVNRDAYRKAGPDAPEKAEAVKATAALQAVLAALPVVEAAERAAEKARRLAAVPAGFDACEVGMAENAAEACAAFGLKMDDLLPMVDMNTGSGLYRHLEAGRSINVDVTDAESDTGLNVTTATIGHLTLDVLKHYCSDCRALVTAGMHPYGTGSLWVITAGRREKHSRDFPHHALEVTGQATIRLPQVRGTVSGTGEVRMRSAYAGGELHPVSCTLNSAQGKALNRALARNAVWSDANAPATAMSLLMRDGVKVNDKSGNGENTVQVTPVAFDTPNHGTFIGLAVMVNGVGAAWTGE